MTRALQQRRYARYTRFTDAQTIALLKPVILDYIQEATEIEKSGKKAGINNDAPLDYPEELTQQFEAATNFEKAFAALTPGQQRRYLIYF